MSLFDKLLHMTEEEGQKKYSDMRSVDVGIGHNDDLAVAELVDVEIVADTATECLNNRNYRSI